MTPYPPAMEDVPRWARFNCLTYAWWAWVQFGGYLLVRQSQIADMYALGPWHPMRLTPHFLVQPFYQTPTHLGPTLEQRERDSARHWSLFWLRLWRIPSARIIVGDGECESKFIPILESRR